MKFAGSVSSTLPLCGAVEWLWTSTGTASVSPMPIDCAAEEKPTRWARGAVPVSQESYSSHLPHRWKLPSTGGTTRTTVSV